jgi:2-succinyl-5-enolpyruvyl-6-hydroxy-3-cyclohexene-1-carboxylate synthase
MVSGSGQSHQTLEAQNWLEEVLSIKEPNLLFVVQMDGPEAETHIQALLKLVNNSDNIFVGNSEQVIDWLNAKK